MVSKKSRTEVREKKHSRIRNHLAGTAERPPVSYTHLTQDLQLSYLMLECQYRRLASY